MDGPDSMAGLPQHACLAHGLDAWCLLRPLWAARGWVRGQTEPKQQHQADLCCWKHRSQQMMWQHLHVQVTVVYAHTGETLKVLDFKGPPSSLLWADSAGEEEAAGDPVLEHTLAVNVAGQTLLICRVGVLDI